MPWKEGEAEEDKEATFHELLCFTCHMALTSGCPAGGKWAPPTSRPHPCGGIWGQNPFPLSSDRSMWGGVCLGSAPGVAQGGEAS